LEGLQRRIADLDGVQLGVVDELPVVLAVELEQVGRCQADGVGEQVEVAYVAGRFFEHVHHDPAKCHGPHSERGSRRERVEGGELVGDLATAGAHAVR
jgi:hypothetical protein